MIYPNLNEMTREELNEAMIMQEDFIKKNQMRLEEYFGGLDIEDLDASIQDTRLKEMFQNTVITENEEIHQEVSVENFEMNEIEKEAPEPLEFLKEIQETRGPESQIKGLFTQLLEKKPKEFDGVLNPPRIGFLDLTKKAEKKEFPEQKIKAIEIPKGSLSSNSASTSITTIHSSKQSTALGLTHQSSEKLKNSGVVSRPSAIKKEKTMDSTQNISSFLKGIPVSAVEEYLQRVFTRNPEEMKYFQSHFGLNNGVFGKKKPENSPKNSEKLQVLPKQSPKRNSNEAKNKENQKKLIQNKKEKPKSSKKINEKEETGLLCCSKESQKKTGGFFGSCENPRTPLSFKNKDFVLPLSLEHDSQLKNKKNKGEKLLGMSPKQFSGMKSIPSSKKHERSLFKSTQVTKHSQGTISEVSSFLKNQKNNLLFTERSAQNDGNLKEEKSSENLSKGKQLLGFACSGSPWQAKQSRRSNTAHNSPESNDFLHQLIHSFFLNCLFVFVHLWRFCQFLGWSVNEFKSEENPKTKPMRPQKYFTESFINKASGVPDQTKYSPRPKGFQSNSKPFYTSHGKALSFDLNNDLMFLVKKQRKNKASMV